MAQYRPKLDPKVDLAGATPETLARALFRRVEPLLRPGRKQKSGQGEGLEERLDHGGGDDGGDDDA